MMVSSSELNVANTSLSVTFNVKQTIYNLYKIKLIYLRKFNCICIPSSFPKIKTPKLWQNVFLGLIGKPFVSEQYKAIVTKLIIIDILLFSIFLNSYFSSFLSKLNLF